MTTLRDRLVLYAAALILALGAATWGHRLAAQETGKPGTRLAALSSPQPDYGTIAESSVFVPGHAFHGVIPNVTVIDDGYLDSMFGGNGPGASASAPVYLPQGALVTGIDLYYYDTNVSQTLYCYLYEVPGSGAYPPVIGFAASAGSAGWGVHSNSLGTWTVNNASNGYAILLNTDGSAPVTDGSIKWRGVRVRYKLQVSPAPGVATFSDVPTDYWAFQYIEALKASGITQGVTPTTYEPESNVTRAKMAVFLAKALGLHWPN